MSCLSIDTWPLKVGRGSGENLSAIVRRTRAEVCKFTTWRRLRDEWTGCAERMLWASGLLKLPMLVGQRTSNLIWKLTLLIHENLLFLNIKCVICESLIHWWYESSSTKRPVIMQMCYASKSSPELWLQFACLGDEVLPNRVAALPTRKKILCWNEDRLHNCQLNYIWDGAGEERAATS